MSCGSSPSRPSEIESEPDIEEPVSDDEQPQFFEESQPQPDVPLTFHLFIDVLERKLVVKGFSHTADLLC